MRFFSRSGCGKFCAVISAGLSAAALLMISGCSVVQVNGTERTADDALCLVRPQIADPALHKLLKDLLARKRFKVTELAPGTAPNVCRQTLVYRWGVEQYYIPALVKQYPVAFDFYESGVKVANASSCAVPAIGRALWISFFRGGPWSATRIADAADEAGLS